MKTYFHFDDGMAGLLGTVTLLASAAGGLLFGLVADRIGRARALMATILIFSLCSLGAATAQSLLQLAVWRTLLGIGMGGEWTSGAVLVSETWPARHRSKAPSKPIPRCSQREWTYWRLPSRCALRPSSRRRLDDPPASKVRPATRMGSSAVPLLPRSPQLPTRSLARLAPSRSLCTRSPVRSWPRHSPFSGKRLSLLVLSRQGRSRHRW